MVRYLFNPKLSWVQRLQPTSHVKGVSPIYKVVIAAGHCIVREGLHILLNSCGGYAVTGEAKGKYAIQKSMLKDSPYTKLITPALRDDIVDAFGKVID